MKFVLPQKYIDEDLVSVQTSEDGLRVFNYTHTCQFARAWDDITMQCRGLVVDQDDNIVARPFKKFFNLGEGEQTFSWPPDQVYEKVDGSLGIFFVHQGIPRLATRGSLGSDQAKRGMEIMLARYKQQSRDVLMTFSSFTHLFEIIYPANKIVVDYGKQEDLVYLGSVNTETGEDVGLISSLKEVFPTVLEHDVTSLDQLMAQDQTNREGFVLRFNDGFRLKVKFEEYKRLHRIVTETSNISIWEHMRDGHSLKQLIENVPDEFYKYVKSVTTDLGAKYESLFRKTEEAYKKVTEAAEVANPIVGKERITIADLDLVKRAMKKQVLMGFDGYTDVRDFLLMKYKGQDPARIRHEMWDKIRPKFSKPFSNDEG